MLKIALTGADGLVGSRVVELLKNDFEFIPLPQAEMDITNIDQINTFLKNINFDIFLHLAAYTNVLGAETNKELCYKINRDGTKNVFDVVKSKGKKFIYVSTDFVFDGNNPPYFEDSTPNPAGVYANSKYQGEKVIGSESIIVRIAYPYRAAFETKRDFFRTFKTYLEQKKPLTMITDSRMTPTFIDDIAYGLKYLFNNYFSGIFHLVGSQSYSPFEAALLIAEKFDLDKALIGKTTFEEYIKNKPGLPKLADIRSRKNNFYKTKSFSEGLEEIKKQL
ncbi:MAG: dTDP-4-dehydrorhamnose reductase [Candidatus Roizmanbacteria bacterium GW2011_GWA2_32_13]|uniref:dTDP-4-dehydrorhamnose reductase n=1 Tax=Candidatus Roizmanbacteria bacterium GW2011_GWA2_32_13 TaxID=1618475 RepID=A0A0G0C332_9BACT|nr:MAG: dTDP-4-dehydrorhamnose reductase [Candidatus Roizmanbacteria bacterium GW2011_GWA2_32_13]